MEYENYKKTKKKKTKKKHGEKPQIYWPWATGPLLVSFSLMSSCKSRGCRGSQLGEITGLNDQG